MKAKETISKKFRVYPVLLLVIIFSVLVIFLLSLYLSNSKQEWKIYSDSKSGYQFQYPSNWLFRKDQYGVYLADENNKDVLYVNVALGGGCLTSKPSLPLSIEIASKTLILMDACGNRAYTINAKSNDGQPVTIEIAGNFVGTKNEDDMRKVLKSFKNINISE